MGEVKIYRGKSPDTNEVVLVIKDEANYPMVEIYEDRVQSVNRFMVYHDLTELSFFDKGTGVWIEGVSAEELLQVLDLGRDHLEGNECGHGVAKRTLANLFAQLSDRESAGGEPDSLGEVVKVTIELSEEDAFEARFHDEDLASNRIGEQICYQVAEQLRTLNPLTPPVEVEEPKGEKKHYPSCESLIEAWRRDCTCPPEPKEPELYGTIVIYKEMAFQKNHVFSHYGIPPKEWFRSGSDTPNSWDDIKDGAEVIYSPSRVIGGEK